MTFFILAVKFSLVGRSNCGGLLRDSSRWFSPVLTNKDVYNNNLDCQWLIQMDRQLRVQLDILHLDIEDTEECMKDFLQVSSFLLKFIVCMLVRNLSCCV